MEKDLIKFNENIKKINKDIAKYEDEKGNYRLVPIGQLMCSCEYLEMDNKEFEQAKFKMILDKNLKYTTKTATRTIDKFTKTQNKRDKGTLIDSEVKVYMAWVISNGIGLTKAFDNKDDALKLVNDINNKYLEMAEIQ